MSIDYVDATCVLDRRGRLRSGQGQRLESGNQQDGCLSEVPETCDQEDISAASGRNSRSRQQLGSGASRRIVEADTIEENPTTVTRAPRSPILLHDLQSPVSISNRRGIDLNIPEFYQLSNVHTVSLTTASPAKSRTDDGFYPLSNTVGLVELPQSQDSRQQLLRSQSLGPLTPPHESDVLHWSESTIVRSPTEAGIRSTEQTSARTGDKGLSLPRDLLPPMQPGFEMPSQGIPQRSWLDRALRSIGRSSDMEASLQYVEISSQVLPNHASDRRTVKTSELICDNLQQTHPDLQGITITHAIAVPQSQVVEDFPKSPPATPNFVVTNGYFDEAIIVTKAANVPLYHSLQKKDRAPGIQIQRRIMVRSIVDLALLERCIPPTTASEITDFFNADSYRSYLADRLSELCPGAGSLLLIYPTRSGGQTFARKCIAPILDPLLRELSILRGLDTDAAQKLGSMESVDSLMEFDEMRAKVETLCSDMSEKSKVLSIRSSYKLVHSKAAQVVLDRNTWMTWYVEQEQQRLKQNLVDYHKDGGRLPLGDGGSTELTAGMLTREIIEGLQKSKNGAGNASIEVGVFVIQRVKRTS